MSSLESNRQAAADFFEQIWNQKDESAIDRFIALDANHFASNGRSGMQLFQIFTLMFERLLLKAIAL
jgi:hypothetical protein